jgi:hypothetical protein
MTIRSPGESQGAGRLPIFRSETELITYH